MPVRVVVDDPEPARGDEVQALGRVALADEHAAAGDRDRLECLTELAAGVDVELAEHPVLLDEPVELLDRQLRHVPLDW